MLKRDLRLSHQKLRAALPPDRIRLYSKAISELCLQLPIWDLSTFHVFMSIPSKGEVDTTSLISLIREKGGTVVVPKIGEGRRLTHHILEAATVLETNSWGIPEPVGGRSVDARDIAVVFIPLLAYDKQGNRVGYGGGYYDRFLSACRPDTLKIGLSFFEPVNRIEDLNPTDIPMDYCVSPEKIYAFRD